jgi:hypothetical protein
VVKQLITAKIGSQQLGEIAMKVMVIVKANADSEAGVMPTAQMLTEMGNYNEELVNARLFDNFDAAAASVEVIDGKNLW